MSSTGIFPWNKQGKIQESFALPLWLCPLLPCLMPQTFCCDWAIPAAGCLTAPGCAHVMVSPGIVFLSSSVLNLLFLDGVWDWTFSCNEVSLNALHLSIYAGDTFYWSYSLVCPTSQGGCKCLGDRTVSVYLSVYLSIYLSIYLSSIIYTLGFISFWIFNMRLDTD